ncbi:efflux RND transporter periplasmic adaptor subunit [Azospirillum thermophilum]|uniref:Efflux transporter periplasmic adaptor subunit n=1 Tax=Azospirillum thermophilum TaxID=2202148 RepID=A0A2S2CZG5_9PROT|nr:efflux RND transporter periplasmic adaptor subunit [Azospirillum thermophilum]AWK89825.1 efflux transporter periplasmic adaptor subunit [Azospirillum thermophilum]
MTIRHRSALACAVLLAALAATAPAVAQQARQQAAATGFNPLEMRAQLTPQRHATLSAEIGARIKRVAFKDGQSFRAGETLVEFDCALQAAQLDKAQAQRAGAENTLDGQRKLSKLNATGMVEVRNAEAEVQKARADVTYLKTMMSKCRIAAPYDGRIVEHKASDQQFVQPGQALMEIIDDSVLELEFIVPSHWLAWFKPGYGFVARIDDTRRDYPVRLLRTAARVDPVSQSVKAVAVIDGRFPELVAGMSGQILLTPPAQN